MKRIRKGAIIDVIAYLLILLFLYTSINKLWRFHNFDWVLATLPVIGDYHTVIAYFVPVAELITCALLFNPPTTKYGLISSFVLMLIFTAYLIMMILHTAYLPCNCGGVISHMSWRKHVAFNLFFLLLSGIALKFEYDLKRNPPH